MLQDAYLQGDIDKKEEGQCLSFGIVDGNSRAVLFESRTGLLALFGTLFLPNTKRLLTDSDFETEFIPAFTENCISFLSNCSGAFCFAYYDKIEGSIFLSNDPFGNLPLYYSLTKDSVVFSTRQRPVALAIGRKISQDSIGQYIRSGTIVGGQTFYENLNRLETASICKITHEGNATLQKYFYPTYSYCDRSEIPDLVSKIAQTLAVSVSREIEQGADIGVALTGGFDSRTTLAILLGIQKTRGISFYTHGTPDSFDLRIASQLCSSFGLPHAIFTFDDTVFSDSIRQFDTIVDRSEGGLGVEAALSMEAMQWKGDRFNSILDSHGGQIYRRTIFKARIRLLKKNIISGLNRLFVSQLSRSRFLLPDVLSSSSQRVSRALEQYFSTLPFHLVTGDKIDRFFIDILCNNKYSNVGNVEMNYTRLAHPLLDIKVAELLSRIPEDFRRRNLVYESLYESLVPELKRFPLENNGYKIPFNGYRWKRYIPQSLELFFKKIGIPYSFQRPITSQDLVMKFGKTRAQEILEENLSFITEYVDSAGLRSEMDKQALTNVELVALTNFALLMRYLKGI